MLEHQVALLRTLVTMCGTMQPLNDKDYSIVMRLYYHEDITVWPLALLGVALCDVRLINCVAGLLLLLHDTTTSPRSGSPSTLWTLAPSPTSWCSANLL